MAIRVMKKAIEAWSVLVFYLFIKGARKGDDGALIWHIVVVPNLVLVSWLVQQAITIVGIKLVSKNLEQEIAPSNKAY